jgi:Ran GTPase-activating protein (RanGAP) involved in mRNA processing and transport
MALAAALNRVRDSCSELVDLDLGGFHADFRLSQKRLPGMPDVWTRLGEALRANTVLTALTLPTAVPAGNRLTPKGLRHICSGLLSGKTLVALDFSDTCLDHEACGTALKRLLANHRTLRRLCLRGCVRACARVIEDVCEGIIRGSSLVTLDLSHNYLGEDGAEAVGDVALSRTPLQELRLSECLIASAAEDSHIPSESSLAVAEEDKEGERGGGARPRREKRENARALDTTLEGPGLWAGGLAVPPATCGHSRWRALVRAVGRANLSLLDLSWNDLGPAAVSALAASLAETPSLATLDVSGCRLEALGCAGLCAGLERNSTLTTLGLSCNDISNEGATRVAHALAGNTTLRRLCLGSNRVFPEGVAKLAESLARNSALTHLGLDGHRLDAASAGALARLLATNSSLASLSLQPPELEGPRAEGREDEGREALLCLGVALRARPEPAFDAAGVCGSREAFVRGFELSGVALGQVAGRLGLPPGAECWENGEIVQFFWDQHARRLAFCMLTHRRLGQASRWGELDEGIVRLVLACSIFYWRETGS